MPWHPISLRGFGGLALGASPPGDPRRLIEATDVVVTPTGGLRRRRAWRRMQSALGSIGTYAHRSVHASYAQGSDNPRLLALRTTYPAGTVNVVAYRPMVDTGVDVSGALAAGTDLWNFADVANGSTSYAYGFSSTALVRYDPSSGTFSTPTITALDPTVTGTPGAPATGKAAPLARCGALWPLDGRLALAGFAAGATGPGKYSSGQATAGPDYVFFSQPNDPERYLETDFVRLGPGDGEAIQAVAAWRDLLFVFKKRRFWVFTGTTTDANGVVSFSRRAIETGIGAAGPQCVAVGPDGVYFVGRLGIYRTRGGEPELVSGPVAALFDPAQQAWSDGFKGGRPIAVPSTFVLNIVGSRLYLTFPDQNDAQNRPTWALVHDLDAGWWTQFTAGGPSVQDAIQAATAPLGVSFELFPVRRGESLLLGALVNGDLLWDLGYSTIDRDYPVGYAQLSFSDHGVGRVSRLPAIEALGNGPMEVGLRVDYENTRPTRLGSTVVGNPLACDFPIDGHSPRDGKLGHRKLVRNAKRGRAYSVFVNGDGTAEWELDEVVLHLAGVKPEANVDATQA